MRVIHPDKGQAAAMVQAMHAVVTARGTVAALPIELDSIQAIARHLLHQQDPVEPLGKDLPPDLAATIPDPVMRRELVRILALLPVIDKQLSPAKVTIVNDAASRLGVVEPGLDMLALALKGKFKKIAWGMMMRSVAHYWSPTGKARMRDWLDMLRIAMPTIPGIYQMLTDKQLLARYQSLGDRPVGTLGRALYDFYTKRGFPMPGEPKSFPEGWSKHEAYHVISEYETSLQGEMLNAAFSGGNTEVLCMDLLLLTLLQFQAGIPVMPGPVLADELKPDAFFRAVARGAAMNVDFLAGWDLWSVVDLPLDEIRRRFGLPLLSAEERRTLAQWDALIA